MSRINAGKATEGEAEVNKVEQDEKTSKSLESEDAESRNSFLMADVVLRKMFEVCDLSDLSRFRLVSSKWCSTATPRFRREMTLEIQQQQMWNYQRLKRLGARDRTETHLQWQWLSELPMVLTDKVNPDLEHNFASYLIRDFQFCSSPARFKRGKYRVTEQVELDAIYRNMDQFFGLYGQHIRKLTLYECMICSMKTFKKAIFEETPNLQELKLTKLIILARSSPKAQEAEERKEVKVQQPNLRSLTVSEELPISWRLFFLHFPNIKHIEPNEDTGKVVSTDLADTLEELGRKPGSHMAIEELVIGDKMIFRHNSLERILRLPQVKLTKLSIWICSDSPHEDYMQAMILSTAMRLHGSTLRELRTTYTNTSPFIFENTYDEFPFQEKPLECITVLHLDMMVGGNLHCLDQFPNLRILRLKGREDDSLEKIDLVRMGKLRLPHVHELRFEMGDYWKCYIPEKIMSVFVKTMPNVVHFKGRLTRVSFRVVCRYWRNLRKLELFDQDGKLDDQAITGIIAGAKNRLPNIGDLRYLQEIWITQMATGNSNITDVSIHDGFLKLPFLHKLKLHSLSHETSDEAFNLLTKRFPGDLISRNSTPKKPGPEDAFFSGFTRVYWEDSD